MLSRLFATLVLTLLIQLVTSAQPPKFLTLPFSDVTVKMQQGWVYTDGTIHSPEGAFDFIKGSIDQSATWQEFDVVAAADGVAVWDDDPASGYGNVVVIRHDQTGPNGQRYFSLYAHLKSGSVSPQIPKLGRNNTQFQNWFRVRRGERLGAAGATGKQGCRVAAQCIHLHFEVRLGGYRGMDLDPYDISRAGETLLKRDAYPGGSNFAACGPHFLWTQCPPTRFVPTTGTVGAEATLNGQPYSGSVNFDIVGPNGVIIGLGVPGQTGNLPLGTYQFIYRNGGPPNSRLINITPAVFQGLFPGSSITFTMHFESINFSWQPLVTGNPGVPGDGMFASTGGGLSYAYLFTSGVPLSQLPNGVSVTGFTGPGAPRVDQIQLTYRKIGDTTFQCAINSNAGIARRVSFAGVPGTVTYHGQTVFQGVIQGMNFNSSCAANLNNVEVIGVAMSSNTSGLIHTTDGIALGSGLNGYPGVTIP